MKAQNRQLLRLALHVVLASLIVSTTIAQEQNPANDAPSVSNNDKAQIIQSMILRELSLSDEDRTRIVKPNPRRIDPCKNSKGSIRTEYILTKNIARSLLPKISCINFVLLGPEEIEAKSQEGIQYLSFDRFEVKGSMVEIHLATVYTRGRFSTLTGVIYEYRKVSGRWRGKQTGAYNEIT